MSLMVVLLSALVIVGAVCVLLAYRLNQVRRAGTPVLLRPLPAVPDSGWRHGTVHYTEDELHYFRLSSLRPGPTRTLVRQAIEIAGRRSPEGSERDILDGMVIIGLEPGADGAGGAYELAMAPGAATAFQSWLESRQSIRSRRGRTV